METGAAGHSGRSLDQKLGLRPGLRVAIIEPPGHYAELIGPVLRELVHVPPEDPPLDLVHVFARDAAALAARLPRLRSAIRPDGAIWVSWPKRASGLYTDLTEDAVRRCALGCGLVDTKVCAVDQTWSGLKLVIRLRDRP